MGKRAGLFALSHLKTGKPPSYRRLSKGCGTAKYHHQTGAFYRAKYCQSRLCELVH